MRFGWSSGWFGYVSACSSKPGPNRSSFDGLRVTIGARLGLSEGRWQARLAGTLSLPWGGSLRRFSERKRLCLFAPSPSLVARVIVSTGDNNAAKFKGEGLVCDP